ncbi:hypothetical protein [Nocardia sp. XZ_19_369]|uniref:hypothetical protein n=1 Tax=Nocardia sp. XZ_19_369 TaxID=2769487 RepID=UPI00188E0E92|nr:hypothetical protein [Nocardia sp. XZ_19_369]
MRIRAAVMAVGIAFLGLTGMSAPANAVASPSYTKLAPESELAGWRHLGWYRTHGQCVDAGQQFQREHAIREWRCGYDAGHSPSYALSGR